MILENKRHLCLITLAFLFGIILYCRKEDVWPALLVVLGAGILYGLLTGKNRREAAVLAGLTVAAACTAFFLCRYQDVSYTRIQECCDFGDDVKITGTVYQKEVKSESYLYYLKTEYKKVLVYYDSDEIPIGSFVTVCGDADFFSHAVNDGNFDLADYYRYQNISFRVFADSMVSRSEKGRSLKECLYQMQKRISAVFSSELNERDAGVLATLVAGNKGLMDAEVKEMYQDAGISHILAISGLHISILGMGIFRFLRRIRCPYPVSAGLGSAVMVCFVMMSGMGVSARRALIMYLVLMGAEVMGKAYDALNALALAALLLLIFQPMALYQSGFQFSFLAMAAIILSGAVFRRREERSAKKDKRITAGVGEAGAGRDKNEKKVTAFWRKLGSELGNRLLSGVFLQMFLLPLTAWIYFEVPVYAMFLNLLVIPLCSWLLGAGLLGGLTGLFRPLLSKWILVLCHLILVFYEKSIALVNCLPFSQVITGKPSAWMMMLYYAVLVGACVLYLYRENREEGTEGIRNDLNRHERENRGRQPVEIRLGFAKRYRGKNLRQVLPGVACRIFFAISGVLLICILFVPGKEICRIDFLDVAQGDGIYLTDGEGVHVMIDGGSSSESSVGEYRIEPFLKYHGVQTVDAWILTHSDSDHYSGLLELLGDGYDVTYLLLAESLPRDETWKELTEAAEKNGTEVVYVKEGDEIRMSGCEMVCLYPSSEDTSDDSNALSQVWSFQSNSLSALFTGDIGEEQEQLLADRGLLTDITVLKVAHHGSKYSSCEEFLEKVSPEYAVISSGEGNSYGHPHAETLERLTTVGCEILQTQDSGQVTFFYEKGSWRMDTYNNRL
ncbi:MAG: ComEC/Rec2 family competence protein [Clostridiales bacterium]|nr:ComEC/Rec2 family competence protein [Clostridiales bacterium]